MSNNTSYVTPQKGTSVETLKKAAATSGGRGRGSSGAVCLVTGQAHIEYFFDPSLILEEQTNRYGDAKTPSRTRDFNKQSSSSSMNNSNFSSTSNDPLQHPSRHLFMPCTIVKSLMDTTNTKNNTTTTTTTTNQPKSSSKKKKKKHKENKSSSGSTSTSSATDTNNNGPFPGPTLVKTLDGTLYKISDSTKLIPLVQPDDYIGLDDVLHLTNVTEASLLHTISLRYQRDDIYTCAGPILISVNPYKNIVIGSTNESIYSESRMLHYRNNSSSGSSSDTLPPHLFQIANRAYTHLLSSMIENSATGTTGIHNQSIIISGESGAGKTEATKIIMQFLARMTQKRIVQQQQTSSPDASNKNLLMSPDGKMLAGLEDRVLSSNPLLETFGNAQTLKNDNSSRFGKYIQIFFSSKNNKICGASIQKYLLEQTRICHQSEGEENYHIFSQLIHGADANTLQGFGIDTTTGGGNFTYLCNHNKKNDAADGKLKDQKIQELETTRQCLAQIGFTAEEQTEVLGMVAAVLHLGNVSFEETADGTIVKEDDTGPLHHACRLLGLSPEAVQTAIVTKTLIVGGKSISKPQHVSQAQEKRNAFSKMTYTSLFGWLVQRVNETLQIQSNDATTTSASKNQAGFIGVLDIYGFEVFEVNGYEQLLINYCNEKLQRHFNRHLFEVEQDLYASEGVDWTYITFNDNRPCLELLEGGGGVVGILNLLDDSWGGMGSTSEKDVKFVAQLHKAYGGITTTKGDSNPGHDYFVTPKFGIDQQFIICHYAGQVRYTASGFVEKNMDTLSNELKDLGTTSTLALAKSVYSSVAAPAESSSTDVRRSSIRGTSVGSQFRASLQLLMSDLEKTQPHYIRCVKPNLEKAPSSLDANEVLRQLRYSGMMEAIRIRREGYALREDHASFYSRFSVLLLPEETKQGGSGGIEQLVMALSKRLNVTDADWQIGHSKIFLRRELANKLERLAKLRVQAAGRTVTRFGRSMVQKRLAHFLVVWMKFRLRVLIKNRRRKAASKIAAKYRAHKQVREFRTIVKYVTKLQTLQRQIAAKKYVRTVRDPWVDMTYEDVKALLAMEQERLDGLVKDKMFQAAAKVEAKLEGIKAALERKRPMTRRLLEEMIADLQTKVDDAVANKRYDDCAPLQKNLDKLIAKREDLPTIEELQKAINNAESQVEAAIAKRDFAGAAQGQEQIAAAKKRMEDALEAENVIAAEADAAKPTTAATTASNEHGITSRGQLETEILTITTEIETSIQQKEFAKASSLQGKLDGLEKLREHFLSLPELLTKLTEAKKRQAAAIASKDYALAGTINVEVDKLEAMVAAEKERGGDAGGTTTMSDSVSLVVPSGETVEFESRADLDSALKRYAVDVSKAVKGKKFKEAQSLQAFVDKLETLKSKLPTLNELVLQVKKARKEMDSAITKKDFATAEHIQERIDALEEKLAKEKSKVPKPPIMQTPAKAASIASAPTPLVAKTPLIAKTPLVARTPATVAPFSQAKTPFAKTPFAGPSQISVGRNSSKPVSKLRPQKAILAGSEDTIVEVCKLMASKRTRAALIPSALGGVGGILTDSDITRRVAAKFLDPESTLVSSVMTPEPTCVTTTDSGSDALALMIENRYRHLPVVDEDGQISGLLDIGKCLNDAIMVLEKHEDKSKSNASAALLQAAGVQGADQAQAAALHALLGPLMAQTMGGNQASPTLRSMLGSRPATIVDPSSSVGQAAVKMAENRKAALIVDGNELVGVLSFKDVVARVIAKEKPLESTVTTVMTPNPESMDPDQTVLEALQIMHDNNFYTLPVCEKDGRVVGLVDVMDVIYGCGGAEGWRSIFDSAIDYADDVSLLGASTHSIGSVLEEKKEKVDKPVKKLRPKKPLISLAEDSVLSVAQMLSSKRGDASLVVGPDGGLAGIITDTDVTRRVVAKNLDPAETKLSEVMTANPTCVHMDDPALDAMSVMVENHFRHLPVVDASGAIVGLLDIAKCLNDAISRLDKARDKNSTAAEDAVKQVADLQGAGAHVDALQALLGPIMAQAFGGEASPKLRSILAGKPAATVSPGTSLLKAGKLMAEHRKAALVVESGKLVGIFGFKDMMNRVVAKRLDLNQTAVAEVMTSNPESVSPEMTVLEALQTMHDNKFLTLPVCEDDGSVVGLVNVMDLIVACGGAEGWRSVFSSAMDVDDVSDTASAYSRDSASRSINSQSKKNDKGKQVSKLRPKKPLLSSEEDTVCSVAQMLAAKRGDASLVVSEEGALSGIITDTDVTRRVVAKNLDPESTLLTEVMTANPTCVRSDDPAMDALGIMVDNHFRHLPVIDSDGAVVGLLDIAKCLNDAIDKLERVKDKGSVAAQDALKQAVNLQGAGAGQAHALQALLGPIMAQAFGGEASPKLRSLLAGKSPTIVSPTASLREAGTIMTENRKASLVVEDGTLVGIFGFKDMMSRAVAKQLDLDSTPVSQVMTPNPESVLPDMTVLEALQSMHDNKFLTLPVCEANGTVVGLVDVMDVINGCGGSEGWRSIFSSVMDMDDGSETASVHSRESERGSVTASMISKKKDVRPVSKLRPKKPLLLNSEDSVLSCCQELARSRGTAAALVDESSTLVGIITDTDITRRVAAKHLRPDETTLAEVMTPNPTCVKISDGAMDALSMMIENRYRHLPVVDEQGSICGVLNIDKCLNDAIDRLERAKENTSKAANDAIMKTINSTGGAQAAALQVLLGPLMAQKGNGKSYPSLRSVLAGKPSTVVAPDETVEFAAERMADSRKAALIVDEGNLVGILSFKDVMTRVIAKELPLDSTLVASVMTPNPEFLLPDQNVMEALQVMHDHTFLTLPVCEEDGRVVGLVDVMDVIYGCGGAEGWRSIFDSAIDMDDDSTDHHSSGPLAVVPSKHMTPVAMVNSFTQFATGSKVPQALTTDSPRFVPRNIEIGADQDDFQMQSLSSERHAIIFKVTDTTGHTHRIRCEPKRKRLLDMLAPKMGKSKADMSKLAIQFVDDEGDSVLITTDDDLLEATELAHKGGNPAVKLTVGKPKEKNPLEDPLVLGGAVAGGLAVLGILLMALRPRHY